MKTKWTGWSRNLNLDGHLVLSIFSQFNAIRSTLLLSYSSTSNMVWKENVPKYVLDAFLNCIHVFTLYLFL